MHLTDKATDATIDHLRMAQPAATKRQATPALEHYYAVNGHVLNASALPDVCYSRQPDVVPGDRMNGVGCAFSQFSVWSPLRVLGLMLALLALVAYAGLLLAWLRHDVSAETV